MRSVGLAWSLGLLLVLVTGSARADNAARTEWSLKGKHVVLSIERLATLGIWQETEAYWASSVSERAWGGQGSVLTASFGQSTNVPRLGLDYVSLGGFTAGGAFGWLKSGSTDNDQNVRRLVIAPRIGGLLVRGRIAFWMRAGITWSSWSSKHPNSKQVPCDDCGSYLDVPPPAHVHETREVFALSAEPQLLICPVPRLAISLGLSLEQGVSGTYRRDYDTPSSRFDSDWAHSSYALTTGLHAIF
jgi:hypothetical protein